MAPNYKKNLLLLIIISALARLITAAAIELGNDEVYYWTYAQKLQWNYFDHPPMVAVWIRLFTANLALEKSEIFIRLGSIVSCAAATVLMFDALKKIHSERAGWFAALLYNASLYAGVIAGIFIMPDSPQMLFWTASLWLLVQITHSPTKWNWWILFGLMTGLCILSKIHAVFLWSGLGLFILFRKRDWLKLPQLYAAVLLTAIVASPILFWNIAYDFITYRYHSERVVVETFRINWSGFARELFGQIFYNNPFNVLIAIAATAALIRKKSTAPRNILSVYNFIAFPMIGILLAVAVFRNTFPHWSGPAYVTLIPLSSIYLAEKTKPVLFRWSVYCAAFILFAGILLVNFFPGTLGKKSNDKLGTGDFTLDIYGWKAAGNAFASFRSGEVKQGFMDDNSPVVSQKWFTAAHEDFYFCKPVGIELIGLGALHDLHHYSWMNNWRLQKTSMQKAWCIVPSNEFYDAVAAYSPFYKKIDYLTTITSNRSGRPCRYFYIYRLSGWKGDSLITKEIPR